MFPVSRAKVDTVLPLSEPVHCIDGTVMTEVPVPKGTALFLNLRGCNTNKALWGEDACEWKPERWLGLERLDEEKRRDMENRWFWAFGR